jgi:hypothetical protein
MLKRNKLDQVRWNGTITRTADWKVQGHRDTIGEKTNIRCGPTEAQPWIYNRRGEGGLILAKTELSEAWLQASWDKR